MSALDIARQVFPGLSDEILNYIIWEHTGYPAFWHIPRDGDTPEECLRTQLNKYRKELLNADEQTSSAALT